MKELYYLSKYLKSGLEVRVYTCIPRFYWVGSEYEEVERSGFFPI